jgi:hypothetical protein
MTRVVLPIAPVDVAIQPPAPRPVTLEGKRLGFLDGWGMRKPDGAYDMFSLMDSIRSEAGATWAIAEHEWRRKARAGSPASPDDLAVMSTMDAVITGTCLSGGCTAGAIDDAAYLESAGVPTITLCQENFEELARAYSAACGFPRLRLFVYPVPVGGNLAADPQALVRDRLDELTDLMFAPQREDRED